MTDEEASRFSMWLRRWWPALLGAAVAVGGGVLWLATRLPSGAASFGWFAYQPLPVHVTDDGSSWAFVAPGPYGTLTLVVRTAGAVLFIAGLVAVAATVGYRAGRARP